MDTSFFYNKSEQKIHTRMLCGYALRNKIKKRRTKIYKKYNKNNKDYKFEKLYIDNLYTRINKLLDKWKIELCAEFDKNKRKTRILKNDSLSDRHVVSVFDSALTRTLSMEINKLSENLIIVQTFFFEVLKDIILDGFMWNGEKYVVYTASAGQIRTKKTVFIKESLLKKYENQLTCGLTNDVINSRGTININKYLAYRALQNSATEEWIGFDIDKCIVVKDFETNVKAVVDYINDETYEITRQEMDIPIPHTDGCGMMLPSFCNKSRMVRLPWVKGLLVPMDFKSFVLENIEKGNIEHAKVKDIYDREYDIIKDDIRIIFVESQFKMYKFYNDWQEYKDNFKKYNCQACYCNEEVEYIKNARINYQMLQTLSDITDAELKKISKKTNDDIAKITNDKATMMKLIGATKENANKNYYQQAVQYYPQLLNDTYSKDVLKQIKRSLVKKAKAAKLFIDSKYTYIIPDLYAFCERLFLGTENPNGLLEKDEVSCNLYNNGEELDCLRSPHLFLEHCVRKNKVDENQKKWFTTKGVYTSCKDTISKILQFDVDGDQSLVCREKDVVKIAKRNIEKYDIVPLYYEMKKADSMHVDNETIYKGLTSAYKGGNIGIISNDISKIWNSEDIDIDAIKFLCMENNFVIDYAKTLYKPKRPKWAKERITKYTKKKLPYFFMYAKDKTLDKVEKINNSVVNKLDKIIINPNLKIKAIDGRFNYRNLMSNPNIELTEVNHNIIDKYKELDENSTYMINRNEDYNKVLNASYVYKKIRDEMLLINDDITYLTDVLIKYLYEQKKSNKKVALWECFGDVIVQNLKQNLTKNFKGEIIECCECGILIEKVSNNTKFCSSCWKEKQKELWQKASKKYRNKQSS